jgi:hypothetical protein
LFSVVSLFNCLVYPSRFNIFASFIILGLFHCYENLQFEISYKKVVTVFVVSLLISVSVLVARDFDIENNKLNFNKGSLIVRAVLFNFSEYNDFVNVLENNPDYKTTKFITNSVAYLFPRFVFEAFGFQKEEYVFSAGKAISAELGTISEDVGIRVGMLGELYFSLGYFVVFIYLGIHFVLRIIDVRLLLGQKNLFKTISSCFFIMYLSMANLYGISFLSIGLIGSITIFLFGKMYKNLETIVQK